MRNQPVNIIIIGGSGFWSDKNHYKNILYLKQKKIPVIVIAIIDPQKPENRLRHKNLQKVIAIDQPQHINPEEHKTVDEIFSFIDKNIDLVIVASEPSSHYKYIMYCLKQKIELLIDKPVLMCEGAASNISSANKIKTEFDELFKQYKINIRQNPDYKAVTILRRRSLESFNYVAKEIRNVYIKYGAWINIMNITVQGGVQKMPEEFSGSIYNAHGYSKGFGSLAHSAYHYIDLMNWYIGLTAGNSVHTMQVSLNYIKRVKDHLATEGYRAIQDLIETSTSDHEHLLIDGTILNSELDVGFMIKMLDDSGKVAAHINFAFNHTSFSPRTRKVEVDEDPCNFLTGGRTSNIYIDIHQSGVQSWQIKKNDIVFMNNKIHVFGRQHPKIGPIEIKKTYEHAYDNNEVRMHHLFENLVEAISKKEKPTMKGIRNLADEEINIQVLSSFYYLISLNLSQLKRFRKQSVEINIPSILETKSNLC